MYSTHGGTAPQAEVFHRRLAKLIAEKRNENYEDVISHMRTRLRFILLKSVLVSLKSVLVSLRGIRGKQHRVAKTALMCLEFGLIPEVFSYEGQV